MIKIIGLEIENVKRVALVKMSVNPNGLTVIGGDNAEGKTSVLDAIVYALGGEKYRPGNLKRDGAIADARIHIEMSNGMIVERKGKNASLSVTDPSGKRSGQKLLDEFVEELALNIPKFLNMKDDEKAEILLKTLGIEEALTAINQKEKVAYDKRHAMRLVVDQKIKYANEMPEYHDVPDVPIAVADLIKESQKILSRNAERDRLRANKAQISAKLDNYNARIDSLKRELESLSTQRDEVATELKKANAIPVDDNESTAELEAQIANIDTINAKIRANSDKEKAIADAEELNAELNKLTEELENIRNERRKLLENADMPLKELSVGKNDKERPILLYNGQPWDCMSGMEQIKAAVAIVRKLKPECGFVLIDGMEAFDMEQLKTFNQYLEDSGLQAITTRVSRGDECTVIIEDGMIKEEETIKTENTMGAW